MREVSARDVHNVIDRGPGAVVIDVLSRESYAKKHIPGSVCIPESDPAFLAKVGEKACGKDTPIVVYCASPECDASVKAAQRLETAGYRDVREFRGGLEGWEEAGFTFDVPSGAI